MPLVGKAEAMVAKNRRVSATYFFSRGFAYANMLSNSCMYIRIYFKHIYSCYSLKNLNSFVQELSEYISPYPCQNTRWMVILLWLLRVVQIIGAKISSVKKDHSPSPVEVSRMLKSVNFWMIRAEQKRLGAWFLK